MPEEEKEQSGGNPGGNPSSTKATSTKGSSRKGFASMDRQKQREIASRGGKAAHKAGTAHQFTSEEARKAGQKGGQSAHEKGTAHRFSSEEAREAGRAAVRVGVATATCGRRRQRAVTA